MTDLVIKDGTGSGKRAKVDEDNNLRTVAITHSEIRHVSDHDGQAYVLDSGVKTLASTAEHVLSWVKLTQGSDLQGYFERLSISWNGGSTNYNRPLELRLWGGMAEPTANNVAFTPTNLNLGSPNVAQGTFWTWDGVGVGMTVAFMGLLVMSFIVSQGWTRIPFNDGIVIPTDTVLGISVIGAEVGDVGLQVLGFFE